MPCITMAIMTGLTRFTTFKQYRLLGTKFSPKQRQNIRLSSRHSFSTQQANVFLTYSYLVKSDLHAKMQGPAGVRRVAYITQ